MVLCPAAAATAQLARNELAEAFAREQRVFHLDLSPNGAQLLVVASDGGELRTAVVKTLDGGAAIKVIEDNAFEGGALERCDWANDTRLVCGYRVSGRRAPTYLAVNADGSDVVQLYSGNLLSLLPDDPNEIVMDDDGWERSVARVNIYTGNTRLEHTNTRIDGWIADGRGDLRLRRHDRVESRLWYMRTTADGPWELLRQEPWGPSSFFDVRALDVTTNEIYYVDGRDGRMALFAQSVDPRATPKLVYANPEFDVAQLMPAGKYDRVVGATLSGGQLMLFDQHWKDVLAALARALPGQTARILDEDWDERFFLVRVDNDPRVYRFDAAEEQLTLVHEYPAPAGGRESPPATPFQVTRADGTVARGAWLAPAERTTPAPAVVFPLHAAQNGGLEGITRFLVASGYAVVLAEFHGFADGGTFGNWSAEIASLHDTVEGAIERGIVDSNRICVAGWDRAAYIGLIAVTEHPELFQCAITIGGVIDVRLYGPPPEGTPSPAALAERFHVPVMIAHGRRDNLHPFQQSRAFHRALEDAGAEAELILFDDADHAILRPKDRQDLYTRVADFLASHLGE